MELISGDYKNLNSLELSSLAREVHAKYIQLGGVYPIAKFKSYTDAKSYADLSAIMQRELLSIIPTTTEGLLISHSALLGLEKDAIVKMILPSKRTLVKIFYTSRNQLGDLNFRKTNIDACYLFRYGKTRTELVQEGEVNSETYSNSYAFNESVVVEYGHEGYEDESLVETLVSETDKASLQYIGLYKGGDLLCCSHVLYSKDVKKYLFRNHPRKKLETLKLLGPSIFNNILQINKNITSLDQGIVKWAVLDIEQGGIFYHHIYSDIFVIGFCQVQANMRKGEEKVLCLVSRIKKIYGLGSGSLA